MTDEQFEVRFLSTEQDFIYNFGANKGHSLSYPKVNRCYFLSAEAKQLYHNICDYAWGGRRDCHPSQSTLRLELGWSKSSMDKYLKELRETGLIRSETQGVNKPLIYYIAELRTVPSLIHSELVHSLREALDVSPEDFYRALTAYKETDLSRSFVIRSDTLVEHAARIKDWFLEYFGNDPDPVVEQPEPSVQPKKTVPGNIPVPPPAIDGLQKTSSLDEGGRKGKVAYDSTNAQTWTLNAFRSHFEDLYERKYKRAYETLEKDTAQLSRLLRVHKENKELVRQYMDAYFELDFRQPKTLAIFCSNYTQSALDEYMRTGKLPQQRQQQSQMAIPGEGGGDEYDDFMGRGK